MSEKTPNTPGLQSSEEFQQRIEQVLLSDKFREVADEISRHTEVTGFEAGMGIFGHEGSVRAEYELPNPEDVVKNRRDSKRNLRGAFDDEYIQAARDGFHGADLWLGADGSYRQDLVLAAHTHPVNSAGGRRIYPLDQFGPSTEDISVWDDFGRWGGPQPSAASRVINGIGVREGDFNKMLLVKRSERSSWIPRYLQYEGEKRGTPFMNKVLEKSGVILVPIDFNVSEQQYAGQAAHAAAKLAETG